MDCVHDSVSFRVGRAITWAPRKVRGGIQCYRDNGAGYTFRRVLYHVGLWEDEEAPNSPENRPKLISGALNAVFAWQGLLRESNGKEKGK